MIKIMNLKNHKREFSYDVAVCRNLSVLGNHFPMENEGERDTVCDYYERWFELHKNDNDISEELYRILSLYKEYKIIRLFCFCAPKRCHAETIKKWLEDNIDKD